MKNVLPDKLKLVLSYVFLYNSSVNPSEVSTPACFIPLALDPNQACRVLTDAP